MELDRIVHRFGWAFPKDFNAESGEKPDIDTQSLTERATTLMETDPSRSLFAKVVVADMETGRLTPYQADQYISLAEEQAGITDTLDPSDR